MRWVSTKAWISQMRCLFSFYKITINRVVELTNSTVFVLLFYCPVVLLSFLLSTVLLSTDLLIYWPTGYCPTVYCFTVCWPTAYSCTAVQKYRVLHRVPREIYRRLSHLRQAPSGPSRGAASFLCSSPVVKEFVNTEAFHNIQYIQYYKQTKKNDSYEIEDLVETHLIFASCVG